MDANLEPASGMMSFISSGFRTWNRYSSGTVSFVVVQGHSDTTAWVQRLPDEDVKFACVGC